MFFYIDESGHTGTNLFDKHQPVLYYGTLSSTTDLDVAAEPLIIQARKISEVERLHASELGVGGLIKISEHLVSLQKKNRLKFDIYRIFKADHAVICFFDQVFDQGMNPAAAWAGYWTPLRYGLLLQVASLFNQKLAKLAWEARIQTNNKLAEAQLIIVCRELLAHLSLMSDQRAKQLIGDVLRWAIRHPSKLNYNCQSKKDVLSVAPNIVGFQAVMRGIASRIETPQSATSIIVDRQCQFNKPQRHLAELYDKCRNVNWFIGPGLPKMDLTNIPMASLTFKKGTESVGLELVDCYLWIFKRLFEGKSIASELQPLVDAQLWEGNTGELSMAHIQEEYVSLLNTLPELTQESKKAAEKIRELDEARRQQAIASD